jgi:hypothetical protein
VGEVTRAGSQFKRPPPFTASALSGLLIAADIGYKNEKCMKFLFWWLYTVRITMRANREPKLCV